MNILNYINRINDLYGNEPVPRRFDTTQWLRPGFRGAGLVDHGPAGVRQGFAVNWTPEKKANLKTWMDNTGSTLEDYNKLSPWNRGFIREGRVTGITQTAEFGKKLEGAPTKKFRKWLSKQDPKTLTADSVDDLIKQSKIKITSRTRSGLVQAINRIMKEKEFAKFKNVQLGRAYSQENINQLSDDLLKAYAKDDITLVMDPKHKSSISDIRSNRRSSLDKAIKNTGLDEETIFNLLDDRDAYVALEKKQETTKGRPVEKGKAKFYKQAENWIIKNSKRYEDPDKFKKAFIRTFGKDNHLIQTINKGALTSTPFSDWFRTSIMGTSEQAMKGQVKASYSSGQLDNIFKTAIYTNNENVRGKIIDELIKVIPEEGVKKFPGKRTMDINKILNENPLLTKFGLNHQIRGPIARLLAKEVGEDLLKQIARLRRPWLGTFDLINYLKDRVNPKYKSMFEETANAVRHAQNNQWPAAKKALNLSQSIMFDHKVPKALIKLGYADEIEYIKLHPTSQQFNAIIKNKEFDKPLVQLTKKWAEAKTPDAKAKVVGEMNELKDNFSKKYGGYLDEVTITPDKTGKPIFSSTADVVTKDTDLVKSLKTSLQHEKFPTMSKSKQTEFLQLLKTAKTAKGPAKFKAMHAIIATVGGGAAAGLFAEFGITPVSADTGVEKAKSWPIEHPWLTGAGATGAAATTKGGRNILGKAFRTLGTPLSGLGWAAYTASDNLKSGKGLTESVVDPLVGMELTFPSMFKENISKITKSPTLQKALGLGKFGSRFMPGVGTAITLGSLSRDSVIAINKEAKRIDAIEDPDQQAEEQEIFIRNIKGYAGGGLANLTRTVAPDSGPMSQGLRSLYIDDMD
jgi:hypothetical protein